MINYSFKDRLKIFRKIVDSNNFGNFFCKPNDLNLEILEFIPNADILELCECMAKEKKNYTISHNQDYVSRTQNDKIKDSFSGIIAETKQTEKFKCFGKSYKKYNANKKIKFK